MKKKIFTLLTLLLCVCSGAWAATASFDGSSLTGLTTASLTGATFSATNSTASDKTIKTSGGTSYTSSDYFFEAVMGSTQGASLTLTTSSTYSSISNISFSITSSDAGKTYVKVEVSSVADFSSDVTTVVANTVLGSDGSLNSKVTSNGRFADNSYNLAIAKSGYVRFTLSQNAKSTSKYIELDNIVITYTDNVPAITASDASITTTISGVEVTQNVEVTGINLSGSTLTATLSPAVDGLSVSLGSNIITDGSISTTATLSYTKNVNARGTTKMILSDGTTTKEVNIYYYAKITDWTLQSISNSTTWSFNDDNITSGTKAGGATSEIVYANIADMTFAQSFDATALAVQGNYPYYSGGSQFITQAKLLKFNTTVRGKVTVSYYSPNSSTVYISVNDGSNGSTISATTTEAIAVNTGNVTIKGYTDEEHETESLLNITQVVFTATPYSVTYNGNGNDSGDVPTDANYYASGETVTVLGNTGSLTKEGKVFGGWNTSADGNGTSYASAATFDISGNITLYAQWVDPTLVAYPGGSRTGYSCSGTTETPSSSGYTLKDVTVYQIQSGKSVTLTVPATTKITKIVVSGTSASDNSSSSYITISRDDQTKNVTLNGRKQALVSDEFVPTSQSTTYTITQKSETNKNSWITIVVYGTENVAKIGDTKWGTFSSTSATTFPVDGISAYKVASIGVDKVVVEPVIGDVPANTGLLLYGNAGEYTIPVASTDGSSVDGNLMTAGTGENVTSGYVLSGLHGDFRPVPTSGVVVPYGKAYLSIPNGTRSLSIAFDDETTGINSVESENNGLLNGDFYNVAGQRVAKPTKGLYIVNGKKVIIK